MYLDKGTQASSQKQIRWGICACGLILSLLLARPAETAGLFIGKFCLLYISGRKSVGGSDG